jgi:aminocarboxymuconate-semialdehyde decarboxylase
VRDHPGRFIGVATIPLLDPETGAAETERAIRQLGLGGVLMYTSHRGMPIDRPELEAYYGLVEELGVPIWLHPERSALQPDYASEDRSRYGMFLIFGWPYETTLAVARLVLSGVMERHPRLKVVAHHAGAMIPRLATRIGTHYNDQPRIELPDLSLPVTEYLKRFYVDTVTQGSVSALEGAREVFGADRMLFASDMPFGGDNGRNFIRLETAAVEGMDLGEEERERIWSGNLASICRPGRAPAAEESAESA